MTTTKQGRPRRDRSKWRAEAYEAARLKRGLTFQAVADAAGVHVSTAARWAQGHPPHASLIPKIARALRVRQKDLTK